MAAHRRLGLNRDQIRSEMQRRINERWRSSTIKFARGWEHATCRDAIAREINHAAYTLRRELLLREAPRRSFPSRHEHYLYLWRVAFHPRTLRLRLGALQLPTGEQCKCHLGAPRRDWDTCPVHRSGPLGPQLPTPIKDKGEPT